MNGRPLEGRRGPVVLVLFFLLVIGFATFEVLLGFRLVGEGVSSLTQGNRVAQVVLGVVWMPVAIALGLFSRRFSSLRVRIGLRVGCALMCLLAWNVVPIGPREREDGGFEWAPYAALGLAAGLVIGLVMWVAVALRRRAARRLT